MHAFVREVHEELKDTRDAGYYTYLKVLQIMDQKGLVRRDTSQRPHVYQAAISETGAEHHLVTDMLERCFEGSTQKLIMRALETRRFSSEELEEIRKMMDSIETGEQ